MIEEAKEKISLNEIDIVDGVVFRGDHVFLGDYRQIDLARPFDYVLFSTPNNLNAELQSLIAAHCYAELSGAKLLVYNGTRDLVQHRILDTLEAFGMKYEYVKADSLEYPNELNEGYDYKLGFPSEFNKQRLYAGNLVAMIHHFPKTLCIGTMTPLNKVSYAVMVHKTGGTTLEIAANEITKDMIAEHFNDCVDDVLRTISSDEDIMMERALKVGHTFDSAPDYDSLRDFDNPVLNLCVAKSVKEMNFDHVIRALRFAKGNDVFLLLKKMGYKW
jgi:hypothetical protein